MERRLSTLSESGKDCNSNGKNEGTEYIPARCRITKPSPPKPAQNPLQFVKVGPCDLYRSAQEQLKKVEVIKKVKQEFKDEGEDWQSNLDNWKSSRRKRQEHIIERVVEIKNMEQEQEKSRRRSKTFSEMLEDRSSRRRKSSIVALYSEADGNDLTDLGISIPSRKGSISGDSTIDDTTSTRDSDELSSSVDQNNSLDDQNIVYNKHKNNNNGLPPASPTKCEEYTYESAIQGYKSRVKRRSYNDFPELHSDGSFNKKSEERRLSLYAFQTLNGQSNEPNIPPLKADVPKIDVSERKQLFESARKQGSNNSKPNNLPDELSQSKSIKERLKHLEKCTEESLKIKKATKLLSGDIMTVRDRLSSLVSHTNEERNNNMPSWASASQLTPNPETNIITSLAKNDSEVSPRCHHVSLCHIEKGRMFHCSLDSLDIRGEPARDSCTLEHVQSLDDLDYCERSNYPPSGSSTELLALSQCGDTDREDSGIQTADVSCSVSQADDPDEDSDTMAAINTVCVEQHLITSNELPLTYLTSVELSTQSTSPVLEQSNVPAPSSKSDSSVVEELITCTINKDLRNKIVFDANPTIVKEETIDSTSLPLSDPLAPPKSVEPPKEKPPPPPVDTCSDDEYPSCSNEDSELKRFNSTKRIKNEIRNKRSSFLGIEGLTDLNDLELTVSKPPDANVILQEELQLEKLLYKQSQTYHQQLTELNNHMEIESRDSGVELESRLMSEHYPFVENERTKKATHTNEEDEISKKEREIIENLEKEEQWRHSYSGRNNASRIHEISLSQQCKSSTHSTDSQQKTFYHEHVENSNSTESRFSDEDVLRVERELLELEKEELERQREDVIFQNRKANVLGGLQKPNPGISDIYLKQNTARPTNSNIYSNYPNYYAATPNTSSSSNSSNKSINNPAMLPTPARSTSSSNYNTKMQLPIPPKPLRSDEVHVTNAMSRHTLQALSAAPRSKLMNTDSWIQSQPTKKMSIPTLTSTQDRENYNQHWLIQEAEQRRLSEPPRPARGLFSHRSSEKHIPDAVVHTLTQRLHNRATAREPNHPLNRYRKDIPTTRDRGTTPSVTYDRSRPVPNTSLSVQPSAPLSVPPPPPPVIPPPSTIYDLRDKMLSVSGKKKCSHCGDELGRGAAMIIESLCLFYHMDCFKCCVCHVQLGDGLMGTDVRVRNHKLHCHNCYSSDDGVKFSCV